MNKYVYVKTINIDSLNQEMETAYLGSCIESIELNGNIVTITTNCELSQEQKDALYEVVLKHKAPSEEELTFESKALEYRIFGSQLADQLTDKFGARNFKNNVPSTTITQLIIQFGPLENALRKGALKTARLGVISIKAHFPVYADILGWGVDRLNHKLEIK